MTGRSRTCCAACALTAFGGLARAQDAPPPPPSEAAAGQPVEPVPEPPIELTLEPPWSRGWTGGVELGMNGSSGNTERFNFRAGAKAERLTERYDTKLLAVYSYAQDDSVDTENRFLAEGRNDWLFKGSPWRVFAKTTLEYDDFKDWDLRWTAHGGVGYEFIKTDKTLLLGRVGLGFAREFGGSDNAWKLEGLVGGDFEHQLTQRQKFTASADFYPELAPDIGPYRIEAKAAWEMLVDPESKMTLKIGVMDRYDSHPGDGFERNDFEYFAMLGWSF